MTDTTMAVATPAVAPPATTTATSTPQEGAFTALLAAALGGVPSIAVTLAGPVEDAVTTDEVDVAATAAAEAEGDALHAGELAALLAAALAVAGADAPVPDPAHQDAGGGAIAPTSGGLAVAEALPASEVATVTEEAATIVGTGLAGRHDAATATTSDRPAAATVAAGTTPATASSETATAELTAPAVGEARAETVRRTEAQPPTGPAPGTPVSSAGPSAPAADVSAPAAPAHPPTGGSDLHARVLGRVMDALDVLENAPPPRRLTVDLPDGDGLRLHVALRGGEVHVSVVGSGAAGDLSGWTRDLSDALAARGFSLGGFSAGTGQDDRRPPTDGGQPADDPTTPRPRPRPQVVDQGLRL